MDVGFTEDVGGGTFLLFLLSVPLHVPCEVCILPHRGRGLSFCHPERSEGSRQQNGTSLLVLSVPERHKDREHIYFPESLSQVAAIIEDLNLKNVSGPLLLGRY